MNVGREGTKFTENRREREEMSKKAASEMFLFRSVLSPRRASEAVSQTASVNGLVGRGQTIEESGVGTGKAIKEDAHPPFANDGEGFFFKKKRNGFLWETN